MFGDMSLPAIFLIAFVIVLALIGVFAWLRFRAGGLSVSSARGRQARLGVIESAAVDGRRRLLLVRRDNVEHLIMVGGPADLLVEANITRAQAVATREGVTQRPAEPGWQAPLDNGQWPSPAEPAPRTGRVGERPSVAAPTADEPPLPPPPEFAPRAGVGERFQGHAAEPSRAGMRVEPQPPRVPEAPRAPAEARRPLAAPPRASEEGHAGDRHLAEMAMQLEAALRRSGPSAPARESGEAPPSRRPGEPRIGTEPREPRSSLVERARQSRASASFTPARSRPATPPSPPPPPPVEPAPDAAAPPDAPDVPPSRPEAPEQPATPASEPAGEGATEPQDGPKPASLEEEMANLLGRSPGKA